MISPARFDRIHAKGAFARLCSMLADPAFAYERIGGKFGLTRQRIAHITTEIYTHVAIRKVKTVHANTHPRA